ncbi:MAG: SUMF1/EgtB/PvdO family nonheme iron enzyme [Proteobacteria bacterium]|nr:SUMF1/EgtB/PvdO family nonheme iron enzyme [Pseudomonadota bacterium]
MHLPPGTTVLGRYEVVATAGHGTWKVRDTTSNEVRALKRLTLEGKANGQELSVAMAARRNATIPGVPELLDLQVAVIDGREEWLLIRQWVEGETLSALVEKHGGLTPDHARWLGGELLWVLERIHQAGRVHGDIQPDNIVLAEDGTEVWLVDAAPMKVLARPGHGAGWRVCTNADYAAPEVGMGGATARSDIYAVGATLLHALTARPPAEVSRSGLAQLAKERQYQIDRALVDVVLKMAQPLADGRFESVAAATHALAHGLDEAEDREWWTRDFFLHPDGDARRSALQVLGFWCVLAAIPLLAVPAVLFPPLAELTASFMTVLKALVSLGILGAAAAAVLSSAPWVFQALDQMVHVAEEKLSVKTREGWLRLPWSQLSGIRRVGPMLIVQGAWELDDVVGGGQDAVVLLDAYDVEQARLARILADRSHGIAPAHGLALGWVWLVPGIPPQLQLALLVSAVAIPIFAFLTFAWSAGWLHGQNVAERDNAWANSHPGQRGDWSEDDVPGGVVTGGQGDVPRLVWAMECPPGMFAGSVRSEEHRILSCDDLNGTMVTIPGVSGTGSAPMLADRAEVTVTEYEACVTGGTCSPPDDATECNFGDSSKGRHPVNCVTFQQASTYCGWAQKRLCSGEEFERMAGALHGRLYPWGAEDPSCRVAVMDGDGPGCGKGGTWPAGSHVAGSSPFAVLDAAGNVAEWTSDAKARGGSYRSSGGELETTSAVGGIPGPEVGFRCCLGL